MERFLFWIQVSHAFTSHKQSCFLTCEKSIYHLWEINLSRMRNQFITRDKKGSDVWLLDGTLSMHRPNSRDFTRNLQGICHIFHNLQQICNTYIRLYIIMIMHVCGRLADFSEKNPSVRARTRETLCKTWIINCELDFPHYTLYEKRARRDELRLNSCTFAELYLFNFLIFQLFNYLPAWHFVHLRLYRV